MLAGVRHNTMRVTNHGPVEPFSPQNDSYSMSEIPIYENGNQYSFPATSHYNSGGHEHYQLTSDPQGQAKREEFQGNNNIMLGNSGSSSFIGVSAPSTNPLFSQDRLFVDSYDHAIPHQPSGSPLGFASVHYGRDQSFSATHDHELQHQPGCKIKIESHRRDSGESRHPSDVKEAGFDPKAIWSGHVFGNQAIHRHLPAADLAS